MKRIQISSFLLVYLTYSVAFTQQFRVSYSPSIFNESFTGSVYLLLSKNKKNPKDTEVGLELFPCYSVYAKNMKPGSNIAFNDYAISYPVKLSDLERGEYFVQAVWDRNLGGRSIAASPGNICSQAIKVTFTKDTKKIFTIKCDQAIPEQVFIETETVKELKVHSSLLTSFYKRPMTVNAAVVLPAEYFSEPIRKFPVFFKIFGYGSDYHTFSGMKNSEFHPFDTTAIIRVY